MSIHHIWHFTSVYFQNNWFEITGMVLAIVGVWFTALEKIINWPIGIVSCIIYGILFYNAGIYADAVLQVFFIVSGVYGWYLWAKGKNKSNGLPITSIPVKTLLILTGLAIPCVFGMAFILHRYTSSTIPYFDAVTTVLSLIATFMAAKKHIENWLVWILADLIYVAEYFIKDLYPTAVLYIIFTGLALYGYVEWRIHLKKLYA
jgi:nicotinamide mononucleotide transporter